MSEERGRFANVWIEYADGDKEATVQEAIDVLAVTLHTELSVDVSVSSALNAGPPPWLSTDLSIPRDLAEELLVLLHDLAGHERVTQGQPQPSTIRCADALRAALNEGNE